MSTEESTIFGSLLRRYRMTAQLTQKQLAARAGLSSSAIAGLEHSTRRLPRAVSVERLATALNLGDAERAALQVAAQSLSAVDVAATGAITSARNPDARRTENPAWQRAWIASLPNPLVDRLQEVETILRMLTVDGTRMLTLVGPAGVGKTRLAGHAAANAQLLDRFPDGVIWIDLAPIRAPQDVLGAIARVCGITDMGPFSIAERLVASLQEQATLLVLDNFEQVLPAAADLVDLLGRCLHLTLLVTSRVPLLIRWEQALRVAPLPVPDLTIPLPPLSELATIPSVTLFLQRARARRASFALTDKQTPMLARLVAQLDGLPLALELAAARLDVLSLPTLTRRLTDRLQLLALEAPDMPERQQSLEAAVGWSYDLLLAPDQRLFRYLGVFVGYVTLDAVASVDNAMRAIEGEGSEIAGADPGAPGRTLHRLLSLAEKSLLLPARPEELSNQEEPPPEIEAIDNGPEDELEPAFVMLETVREYAWERLATEGELTAARRAHAHYFLGLAERADLRLRGPGQRVWWLRLDQERDNLRAALRWLLDQDEEAERAAGLRLAGALGWFWAMFGYHSEGVRWLEEALAHAPKDPGLRLHALVPLGIILSSTGKIERMQVALKEALSLAEGQDPKAAALATMTLGVTLHHTGRREEGTRLMQDALRQWESLGDLWGIGLTQCSLGLGDDIAGDTEAALPHYTVGVQNLEAAGDTHHAGYYHCYLGVVTFKQGDLRNAVAQVQAGLQTSIAFRDRWLLSMSASATLALAQAHAESEQWARLLGAADALTLATGARTPRNPGGQEVEPLREQLARGEGEHAAAYRHGGGLTFRETTALALHLLEVVTQTLSNPARAPQRATRMRKSSSELASQNPLTEREREVLRLVAQGLSSKLIARQLSIATGTVNYHLATVFNKLGVYTRAQAAAVAIQRHLL